MQTQNKTNKTVCSRMCLQIGVPLKELEPRGLDPKACFDLIINVIGPSTSCLSLKGSGTHGAGGVCRAATEEALMPLAAGTDVRVQFLKTYDAVLCCVDVFRSF